MIKKVSPEVASKKILSLISDLVSSQLFRENVSDERIDIDHERTDQIANLKFRIKSAM